MWAWWWADGETERVKKWISKNNDCFPRKSVQTLNSIKIILLFSCPMPYNNSSLCVHCVCIRYRKVKTVFILVLFPPFFLLFFNFSHDRFEVFYAWLSKYFIVDWNSNRIFTENFSLVLYPVFIWVPFIFRSVFTQVLTLQFTFSVSNLHFFKDIWNECGKLYERNAIHMLNQKKKNKKYLIRTVYAVYWKDVIWVC